MKKKRRHPVNVLLFIYSTLTSILKANVVRIRTRKKNWLRNSIWGFAAHGWNQLSDGWSRLELDKLPSSEQNQPPLLAQQAVLNFFFKLLWTSSPKKLVKSTI